MTRIYNAVAQIRRDVSNVETQQYRLSQEHKEALRAVREEISSLFKTIPLGLMLLTPAFLSDPQATYLLIDLEGRDGGICYGSRVSVSYIGFYKTPAGQAAQNIATDEFLGEVNAFSFEPSNRWPDWMVYTNHPERRKVWTDIALHSAVRSDYVGKVILPVDGPALRHPAFMRLANYARSIMDRNNARMERLRAFDAKFDALAGEKKRLAEQAKSLALRAGEDPVRLTQQNPEIAHLIQTMDWTYDMADRPSAASRNQELAIRSGLARLPLDQAVTLFVANEEIYWGKAIYYLQGHPEVTRMKAAA